MKRPGWKMAQHLLERKSHNQHELRVWLVSVSKSAISTGKKMYDEGKVPSLTAPGFFSVGTL